MIPVQDYSDWNIYDGASEGSGRSEKIWLTSDDGNIGLFKFPKSILLRRRKRRNIFQNTWPIS